MDPIYDLASIRKTLRDGITKNYWTLEQLDTPSLGRRMLEEDMKHHKVIELRSFQLPPHRNLLRDHHPEAVQAGPDPRDLAADPQPSVFPGQSPLRTQRQADPLVGDQDHQPRQEPSGSRCDMESPF